MYHGFFGFRADPFGLTPDPTFLYLNASYREALAALRYGVTARKGFVSLIGEAGTGKTTLLRCLLAELGAEVRSVLVLNPAVAFDELLTFILSDLGRPPRPGTPKIELLQTLNAELLDTLARGGNVVVLIDEAQDLAIGVLEELRLLSNLETAKEKILQFVLAGQPELDDMLASPALRQLRQRIAVPARLRPLKRTEVAAYVHARVTAAGGDSRGLFTPAALDRLWRFSRGVPRLVNVACDAALVNAYAAGVRQVGWRIMQEVMRDFRRPAPRLRPRGRPVRWRVPPIGGVRTRSVAVAAAAGLAIGLALTRFAVQEPQAPPRTPTSFELMVAEAARRSAAAPQAGRQGAGTAPAVAESTGTEQIATAAAVRAAHQVEVEVGDTLGHIARRYYGSAWPRALEAIRRANPALPDLDTLAVGQTIVLPAYEGLAVSDLEASAH